MLQRIDLRDPRQANQQALRDLENGATGLTLVFPGAIGNYGFALPATKDALAQVLDQVWVDAIDIELDLGMQSKDAARLAEIAKERGIDPAKTHRFGYDPLGMIAHHGGAPMPWKEIAPVFAAQHRRSQEQLR